MKAVLLTKYGSPDDLQYVDVDKPTPNDNQALVKVVSASLNISD
jgi:NADPH:quinone reductase-like Zn-dependent oxidoreductase